MPVDTSIYSQVSKGGNISDLVESYNKGVEARQQRKLSDLALSKAEREAAQGKALNDAYASNISPEGKINRQRMISQLSAGGHGMAIPQLQQAWSTQDKSEAETLEKRLDVAKKQVDYFHGTMAGLLAMPEITDDALIRATSDAVNRGFIGQDEALEFVRTMPPDQTSRRAILMDGIAQSADAAKQLEMFLPKVSAQNLGGHMQMVDTNPLTNPGVVGQRLERSATQGERVQAGNLALSRERLQFDRQKDAKKQGMPVGAPIEVTQNGAPVLVQRYGDGSLRPVDGFGPKTKDGFSIETNADGTVRVSQGSPKLTEQQSKDLVYLTRGESSLATLDTLDEKLANLWERGKDALPGGNFLVSPEYQQANQAGKDFLAVILRKDTGAAVTKSEEEMYGKIFLPQPGDSRAVLTQKAQIRRVALDAIRTGLGSASSLAPPKSNEGKGKGDGKVVDFSDLK